MYVQYTTIAALLSLLSCVQSTALSVTCAAPWVSTAVKIFDDLPSSEGFYYCSTLLSKYKTVTGMCLHILGSEYCVTVRNLQLLDDETDRV